MTKARNLKVKFDKRTLNGYFGLEDVEPKEYLTKLAEKEEVLPWLADILPPSLTPP